MESGPMVTVEPIRASDVQAGELLAGMGGPCPHVALVTSVRASEDGTQVAFSIADDAIFDLSRGDVKDGEITYDALDVVARLVKVGA